MQAVIIAFLQSCKMPARRKIGRALKSLLDVLKGEIQKSHRDPEYGPIIALLTVNTVMLTTLLFMKPHSILIVDQQEVVRDSLHLILSEEGFRCYTAYNSTKAKEVLTEQKVDLIVVDSQLLIRNGLFSFIKEESSATKIIIMTSYVEIEVTQKALLAGAHDFIIKPLDFKELIDKVMYYLPSIPK